MNTSTQFAGMLLPIPQLPTEKFDRSADSRKDEPITRLHVSARSNLPVRRAGEVPSTMTGLACSTLRRVKQEIDNNDLDMRIVMSHCRGLRRGTSRFEDAYIAARLDTLSQQRHSQTGIPHMVFVEDANGMTPGSDGAEAAPAVAHPLSVTNPYQLARFFGPWIAVILASQFFIVWMGSAWIDWAFSGGRGVHAAILLVAFLWVDSVIWLGNRGKHFKAFMVPGAALLAGSLLGCVILHLAGTISSLS